MSISVRMFAELHGILLSPPCPFLRWPILPGKNADWVPPEGNGTSAISAVAFFLVKDQWQFWTLRRALIPDSGSQNNLLCHLGRVPFLFRMQLMHSYLGGCTIDCSCQARVLCTYAHCLWAVWSLKRPCFVIVWPSLPGNKPLKVTSDI